MASQKVSEARQAIPEERGVLLRTPQRRRMKPNAAYELACPLGYFPEPCSGPHHFIRIYNGRSPGGNNRGDSVRHNRQKKENS